MFSITSFFLSAQYLKVSFNSRVAQKLHAGLTANATEAKFLARRHWRPTVVCSKALEAARYSRFVVMIAMSIAPVLLQVLPKSKI